jgi:histidine phosphotransferase ChpT
MSEHLSAPQGAIEPAPAEDVALQSDPQGDLRLAELLCSRLCHDLVSPVSALNNGVEFLAGGATDDETTDLIAFSAEQVSKRLQVLRMAFGAALNQAPDPFADARQAVLRYFEAGKSQIDWPAGTLTDDPPAAAWLARAILNAIMLLGDALTRGGTIFVRPRLDHPGSAVELAARGPRLTFELELEAVLDGRISLADTTARTVQALLVRRLALMAGYSLLIERSQEGLSIIFQRGA